MRIVLLVAKIVAVTLAGLIALMVLYFGAVLVRRSMPYVFAGDIERLAASGPYNGRTMATEMCGASVDLVGSAKTDSPLLGLPEASVVSWRPLYPIEGTAVVRVTGVGFIHLGDRVTGPCEATMTFRYRFMWSWNGRATVLESSFVDAPKITRP